ncbi:protein HEG isoform X2 [Xyrauchen texanus]|uniref:protein HEG isoform X2 n=1 Tax=Xyrauchen texanus TaxID=154827 RepID=UPI002241F587|nr:protein HEG isoform X2 [Xyrauchen texanus]
METCGMRRAHCVVFAVLLFALNTVIAETFSPRTDSDRPLSSKAFSEGTTGLKHTTSWLGRGATATALDQATGQGDITDIPASVSITEAQTGQSGKTSRFSANTADWTTQKNLDDSTILLRSNKELTQNSTAQWEGLSIVSHSISSYPTLSDKQQPGTDESTEQLQSNKEFTHNATFQWEDPSVVSHGTSSYQALSDKRQPATESRTGQDIPVTDLREHYVDTVSNDLVSHTDSTYISKTSRVGERILLSVSSNSTSPYIEISNSSEVVSQTFSWKERVSEVTQGREQTETVEGVSTASEQTEPTSEDHNPTNATQGQSLETERSLVSQDTESQTGQPSVTEQNIEHSNSTPSLTVINTGETVTSVNGGTPYTESDDSVSSIAPFTLGEHNASSTSLQNGETTVTDSMGTGASTKFSTGTVSSNGHEEPKETPTHTMDETTVQGLTTAPPVLEDVSTTIDDSYSRFIAGESSLSPKAYDPTYTEVLPTPAGPVTQRPQLTEEATDVPSTVYSSTNTMTTTTAPLTTRLIQPSTTPQTQTEQTTLVTTGIVQVLQTTTSTAQRLPTSPTGGPQAPITSNSADVTTLHLETSTATPGNTTAHGRHVTTPYSKSTPASSTVVITTRNHRDSTTEMGMMTTQMPSKSTPSPDHVCGPNTCANGGHCERTVEGKYSCQCLSSWTGPSCTEDVDECMNNPCPQGSVCVNTGGSFSCECSLGFDLEDGRSCVQVKTYLGTFIVNNSMHLKSSGLHELHKEILQLLNASLSIFHGYRRSTMGKRDGDGVRISVVNMFSLSANVTSTDVNNSIQMSLSNCSRTYSHCTIKLQHQLSYHVESLCLAQKTKCDLQYSVCVDASGTPYCQCHPGYIKKNPGDMTCRDCGDGLKLVNGNCVECMFGFGGFNCNNFYKLIAVVVSPAGGALLLIVIIALIVTCCKKDKNDINKIIFKSGDLQMSPYAEFPKSNRVSMEWGRETIEMQENGSTKNLLQMTDIYYSPALRNSDLERNGLYPFSGLPGSRHSCIYPAQWNPSFTSDDSRRRDYF